VTSFSHFWGDWLPNSPYEYDGGTRTGKFEFEFYDQRYTQSSDPNAEIDLYFPKSVDCSAIPANS
jgi:predicted transcriptional regulator YdeE